MQRSRVDESSQLNLLYIILQWVFVGARSIRVTRNRAVLGVDADQLIVRNVNSAFRSPFAGFIAARAYWIDDRILSSTCMLIESNPYLWSGLIVYIILPLVSPGEDRYLLCP